MQLIQEPWDKSLRVLDIGYGCGALMGVVKGIYPNAKIYGVETVPEAAKAAKDAAIHTAMESAENIKSLLQAI